MTLFTKPGWRNLGCALMLCATIGSAAISDAVAQRRGGSFGGSRGSSRSFSTPRGGGGSFGGSRRSYTPPRSTTTPPRSYSAPRASQPSRSTQNSFGGSRLNSSQDYRSRYGTPRSTTRESYRSTSGASNNYVVHRYGGMGDGFMMGYMMGSIPWYYSMPFHPAYYYSRPATMVNPDGTTSVYPGTFQWGTLLFTLLLVGGIIFILYVWIRSRRRKQKWGSADMSESSFG